MKSLRKSLDKGFTLIEVVFVIALIALAVSFSVLIGLDSVSRFVAIGERDLVVTFLVTARTHALTNVDEGAHGLHIDGASYVLFTGDSYDPGDPDNRSYVRDGAITITGPEDIIFEPLSGSVNTGTGTLIFTDNAQSAEIVINEEGRIEW